MSGHNKWSTIKHKKGAADAKRGKIFTKIIREMTIAARTGGADPSSNPRLRLAMYNARANNMPKDTIEKAVKRGTGELEGVEYTECLFEGYGANGVAVLVEAVTDNNNRTAAEIRTIFQKGGGALGAQGSVAWMFEKKGQMLIDKKAATEDQLMEICLSAGAEDILDQGDYWEVKTAPADFEAVKEALDKASIACGSAEISMLPKTTVKLNFDDAQKIQKMFDLLEDHDDVQKVHGNHDIPPEIADKLNA